MIRYSRIDRTMGAGRNVVLKPSSEPSTAGYKTKRYT